MSGADVSALSQAFTADNGQHNALTAVVEIHLVAGLDSLAGNHFRKAVGLCGFHSPGSSLPLHFTSVHKGSVANAVAFHFCALSFRQVSIAVFGFI